MLIWFVGTAWVAVWAVLGDRTFDYRLLALGAVMPDLADVWFGGARVMHSITASIGLLVVIMLATIGRRPIRRRLLAIPFGTFLHLVFDGAFNNTKVFWWPVASRHFTGSRLPSVQRGWISAAMELVGVALLAWWWKRFEFSRPSHRTEFLRTGHLPTDV